MTKSPFKPLLLFFIQNRTFSSSPSSFTVQYLMESCGLSSKSALSISQKLHLNEGDIHKTESVLTLLKSHGFNNAHIVKFIEKHPRILLFRINSNLKPKLEFLVQNGLVGELLPEVLVKSPFILNRKLSSHIKPSMEFLWEILQTEKRVVSAVKRGVIWPFQCKLKDIVQPNIDLLVKEGVPVDRIANFIAIRPGIMLYKVHSIAHLVETVKELGIQPSAPVFMPAIYVRSGMRDSVWNRKVQIFESWGLSEEETVSAFRRYPFSFACSEENLMNTMDFYVNTAKLKPGDVADYPVLLTLSVDKRLRPRYNVYAALMEKELLNKKSRFASLLLVNERDFLENYVTKHMEALPSLMEIYSTAKNGTFCLPTSISNSK